VRKNAERINALVFDNGQACAAHNEDVNALLPKVKADLVYFDPPYATEFSTTNYEKSYVWQLSGRGAGNGCEWKWGYHLHGDG